MSVKAPDKKPSDLLFACSIGPVASFVAASRRSQDLFAGSGLASEWARLAARHLAEHPGVELLYPLPPEEGTCNGEDGASLDTPSYPVTDRLLAKMGPTVSPEEVSQKLKATLEGHLRTQLKELREKRAGTEGQLRLGDLFSEEFDRQVAQPFIELCTAWAPLEANAFGKTRERVEELLNAQEQSLLFNANEDGPLGVEKSDLDGRSESALVENNDKNGSDDAMHHRRAFGIGKNERLGAVDLLKRLWEKQRFPSTMYIAAHPIRKKLATTAAGQELDRNIIELFEAIHGKEKQGKKRYSEIFKAIEPESERHHRKLDALIYYPDRLQLALNRSSERFPADIHPRLTALMQAVKEYPSSPYYTIVSADGDHMSERLKKLPGLNDHQAFTKRLSCFGLKTNALIKDLEGFPVYIGGDDIVLFAPVGVVLGIIQRLRALFLAELGESPTPEGTSPLTMSFGVAIAHMSTPMQGEVYRASQEALACAKAQGKNRVSFTLMKRSGAPVTATLPWPKGPTRNPIARLEDLKELHDNRLLPKNLAYVLRDLAEQLKPALEIFQRENPNEEDDEAHRVSVILTKQVEATLVQKDLVSDDTRKLLLEQFLAFPDSTEGLTPDALRNFAQELVIARFLSNFPGDAS